MVQLLYIALYIFYTGVFLFGISKLKFFEMEATSKKLLSLFFLLKVVAGLLLTLVYTYYYTDTTKADIYRYFNDSKIISSILFSNPKVWLKIMSGLGINDADTFRHIAPTWYFSHPAADMVTSNSFFIRVLSVLNYFSFYNIYINTLLLNFIAFTGLVALYKTLRPYFDEFEQLLYLPVFLLPSVVFWSSGLLKESFLLTGIALYLYAWPGFNNLRLWKSMFFIPIALMIIGLTKIYVAVLLLSFSLFLPSRNSINALPSAFRRRLLVFVAACLVVMNYYGQSFCEKIIEKRNEFTALVISEKAGSALDTKLLTPDCSNLISILPSSLVNSVLRPFIWAGGAIFQSIFAVENAMFILLMLVLLTFFFKWPDAKKLRLAVFCFLFAFFNYLIIGLTVPVMGAIVHYRVVAAPFLFIGVLLLLDLDKIKSKFNPRS